MGGGTEAFPDLGRHCQNPDCHQLDFLPFKCDGCGKAFCLDHRSYKSHDCPKSDQNSRKVVVCEVCSTAIEVTGREGGDVTEMLKKHEESKECDPSKKVKPRCAVRRCRETLAFSNAWVCKSCRLKVCLKHRFPADHDCKAPQLAKSIAVVKGQSNDKVPLVFASKNSQDCAKNARPSTSKPRIVTVRAR